MSREALKESAKKYIEEIYKSHINTDVEAWNELISTIFLYIDEVVACHEKESHDKTE